MKIIHIVGNRPQFIKLALLNQELEKRSIRNIILHTGQHFDAGMSDIFFEELAIPMPQYQLDINSLPRAEMISAMVKEAGPILDKEKPDAVIVYGDTNTTLAGALASKSAGIPVVHIEAGVRTGDLYMPEEVNRRESDAIAWLNCCCTSTGITNLQKEGQEPADSGSGSFLSGDLMLDAIREFSSRAETASLAIGSFDLAKPFILATIHRAENTADRNRLSSIMAGLCELNKRMPVVLPLHPKTRQAIQEWKIPMEVIVTPPLGYLQTIALTKNCQSVITDSGGLSREGFFLQKPVLVIMDHPFWPELFEHGNCLPSAANTAEILRLHGLLISRDKKFRIDIFGDGHAASRIAGRLLSAWQKEFWYL